jgi:hypothetical protein
MAIETGGQRRAAAEGDETADAPRDRNDVAVQYMDGTEQDYAVVIRPAAGGWFHAERLVGEGDGLDEEEFEAINPDAVRRVRSDRVHYLSGCAVHCGDGLLADPETLLAECGLADSV